ncbi:MAG: 23S rRNA (adenine(2503)-C(2))-methyltransferase RlmN [Verrucomicrobia bacterium]|nr:23S rRNA (adenine(2503)-C(2))-methyltransferase RlmN [Verrucomicrobiota bacterium]
MSILALTQQEYSEEMPKGKRHAALLYRQWMRTGHVDTSWAEPQARALVQEMIDKTDFSLPPITGQKKEGETIKFLLRMKDGLETETVAIPMKAGITLCLSSQLGCRMGCTFCETGRMGLLRSLTPEEIVAQVFVARHVLKIPVRNLVFMGMGEPLDNLESVLLALKVLTDPRGLGIGPRHITISTSGHVDGIYQLIARADPALHLAVSVNAPSDEIRRKIMPVNARWNMEALKKAMLDYCAEGSREILIEYVLLENINDGLEHANLLAVYLSGLSVKVNLIPYNSQSRSRFSPPKIEIQEAFMQQMRKHGYQVLLRHHKGREIMAACGQLGNISQRRLLLNSRNS